MSTQEDTWPTWFVVGLFVFAMTLLLTGLFLSLRRPPAAGPVAGLPTTTATAEVARTALTGQPTLMAEGTATPAVIVRRTVNVELTPTPAAGLATPTAGLALTATTVVVVTGTPAPRPPASPTTMPAATGTAVVVMPSGPPGEAGDMGTIEGQVALQGRQRHTGIMLLVNGAPAGTTDATGAFHLTVPAGHHAVRASYSGYIAAEAPDVEVRAGEMTSMPAISLRAGDTDHDGDVDLYDVVRCAINFGRKVPAADTHADVNEDGVIDLRDVILVQRNYRGIGPAPWR